MPRRNLRDDASDLQFGSSLPPGPRLCGASRFGWGFTGQSCHLTALFGGKRRGNPRPGRLLQPLGHAERLQIDPVQARPAIPPQPHRIDVDDQLAGNLRIGGSLGRRSHDAGSQHHVVLTPTTLGNLEEFFLLWFAETDRCGTLRHG
jgi:hypothetical protein